MSKQNILICFRCNLTICLFGINSEFLGKIIDKLSEASCQKSGHVKPYYGVLRTVRKSVFKKAWALW